MGLNFRRYNSTDNETVKNILLDEGLKEGDMFYDNEDVDTFLLTNEAVIVGFFSIKNEYGFPSLQHFIVAKGVRSLSLARILVKFFVGVLRINGVSKAILHAKEPYLRTIIEYYFKVKPYAIRDGRTWYLINV